MKPSPVTISLISLPSVITATKSQSVQVVEKKAGDEPESQSINNKRAAERTVSMHELPGDSVKSDIPPASGITESNALTDLLPRPVDNGYKAQEDPQNGPEGIKRSYQDPGGEIQPYAGIVKEAVPLYKENPAPEYPRLAKKRGYEGTVILEVLVTKEGKAGKVSLFQSSRYSSLDEAAVSSVRKWRFEPGKRGDNRVEMTVKIPVRFKLEED
jgi:protein TonB